MSKITGIRRKSFLVQPWHLLLLPVFFVLHGFTENFFLVPVRDALLLLMQYLSWTFGLTLLGWLYLHDKYKAAMLALILMSVYFFWGYFHDALQRLFPGSWIVKYTVFLPVIGVLLGIMIWRLKKMKQFPERVTAFANLLFLLFMLIDAGLLVKKVRDRPGDVNEFWQANYKPCQPASKPDIYLIVADEYAGAQELNDVWGFDNTPFLDSLRGRGFFVAAHSRSNYDYTPYSVASLLSMEYHKLKGRDGVFPADPVFALKKIVDNNVISFLTREGYQFYNYSWFYFGPFPSVQQTGFVPANTELFTSQTLGSRLQKQALLPFAEKWGLGSILREEKERIFRYNEEVIAATEHIAKMHDDQPRVIYTHLAMPHFPFYSDKSGTRYPYEKLATIKEGDNEYYLPYLQYTNVRLLKLVDHILVSSRRPPVILLLSDHGYRKPAVKEKLPYRFMNLFSIYQPGKKYEGFSDSVTNVNAFRLLLNSSFCQQLPLLKDTTYSIRY